MRLGRVSERARALRKVPVLRDLDKSDLEEVARITYEVSREPGYVLMQQGDLGTELLLLLEGTARVERDGKVIDELGPNSVIGEMALIDHQRRSASVIATTQCDLLVVPYDRFGEFVERVPKIQRQLLITLSKRVRELQQRLTD